jgi:hypothetical protein
MVARRTIAKKKPVEVKVPRKSSVATEEKHVGYETKDWTKVRDVEAAVYETLRHLNYFYDNKEGVKWVAAWMKKNMSKEDLRAYMAAEPWRTSMTAAGMCRMHMNGAPFTSSRMEWIKNKLQEAINSGRQNLQKKLQDDTVVVDFVKKTPADIIKQKTQDFIAEIEYVIDTWLDGVWLDIENYSVYNEMKKIDAPSNIAKATVEYYTPLKEELQELITKKTPDLVEGYRNMPLSRRKEYLKLITAIIDDAERYLDSKKAVRKTRVAKPKSATQLVAKIKYMKESAEFKLTSIDPANIIGSEELWLFNVKYRTLIRCVTQAAAGFTLKGTTLQGMDEHNTSKKKLRKPDETLRELMSATKAKIGRVYTDIKTVPSEFNGRINEDTIILKAFK